MAFRYDARSGPCTGHAQIGLVQLANYVLGRWGGKNLGIYACRSVRGGDSPSMHGEGRAWDWLAPSFPALDQAIDLVVDNANVLNVQCVTDYARDRRWQVGHGWRTFTGPGADGPTWHVERNRTGAADPRSIGAILGGTAPAPKPPVPEPEPEPAPVPMEDADMLPVMKPDSKAGPQSQAGNRMAFFRVEGQNILGFNGAAIAGDHAWPAHIPYMTDDEASVKGLTFRYLTVPLQPGVHLVGITYFSTGPGKVDVSRITVAGSDGSTFTYVST
jgi:hypothetical protein